MTKRMRKRTFAVVRVLLCALFVTLVVRGVTFHDRVTIAPAAGDPQAAAQTYSLIEENDATVTVRGPGGTPQSFSRARIAVDEKGEPRIERGLAYAWRQSDSRVLVLAVLVFAPVTLIQSLRFQLMLRAQEIRLTYWESIKLSYGGNFLNFVFLIGSTAGDVFKAYYTSLHTTRKTEAVTTILLDRIVGMAGLLIVAGVVSLAGTDDPTLRQIRVTAWVLLGAFAAGAWVVTSRHAVALTETRWMARLPAASHLKRMHLATERLVRHRPMLAACLLLSTVLQLICVGAGTICAYALHMNFEGGRVWDFLAYIGSGNLIAAIPISVQGLGTMELAYKQFFLGGYGTLPQLLCLALWVRLLQLFWALPGAFVAVSGAYRPRDVDLENEIMPA